MSRRTEPRPFWSQSRKPPVRLAGSWPDLVGKAGAALPEGGIVPGYDRGARYALGELLDHGVYGVGVVVELAPGKVGVRFCDADRLLVAGQPR